MTNQKFELTKKIADILNLSTDEKNLKKLFKLWWLNPRDKDKGGYRLTELGFKSFQNSQIKSYEIVLETPIQYTNSMILWLDQKIESPYYIDRHKIYVFGEKTAVQILLFSGDLNKMKRAQERFHEKIS